MRRNSILTCVDSYKCGHYLMQPPNTTHQYSYIESRGGDHAQCLFFGLQMFLPTLTVPITAADIDEAEADITAHGEPFNRAGWEHILQQHAGYLPVRIKAVPEGLLIPVQNVLVTVENTDPACAWLTSYLETSLLRAIWYPTTVASLSWACKVELLKARMTTCDEPLAGLPFSLHNFGSRGCSSAETAELGGAAHLVNFLGTDTLECLRVVHSIYHEPTAGFSVLAAEHSTITSWRDETDTHESAAYEHMLTLFDRPGAVVAVVADSYDFWYALEHLWGDRLKQKVLDCGGQLVIRADSGNPVLVPVQAVGALSRYFGHQVNSKGFKVLPSCVRVLQGDGINRLSMRAILDHLTEAGFAAENIVFGMGSGLLQQVTRDTMRFAMKCSAVQRNGIWQDVYKAPVDAPGKRSKAGRLALIHDGKYRTVPLEGNEHRDLLRTVYEDGKVLQDWTFNAIRHRAHRAALRAAGYSQSEHHHERNPNRV